MTSIPRFTAFAIVACGLSFAAPRPEASIYIDGNISALKPNTGGTLVFQDADTLLFKTSSGDVAVPYKEIRRAELGASHVHSRKETPAYKVWDLPKRLHKNETQLLTVEFQNPAGEEHTMTLELPKPAAANVLAEIQDRTAKKTSAAKNEWWGDSWWKTERNAARWDNQQASAHQ